VETKQIVVFKLLDEEYSIDIMHVLEIINYEPIREVPEVPDYVEGIVNLRGTIYPIFNLRTRLHMMPYMAMDDTKIILIHLGELKVGMIVDSVCEILTIQEEELEQKSKVLEKYESKYIEEIVKKDDRMIVILNVDLLLADDEEELINHENNSSCNAECR